MLYYALNISNINVTLFQTIKHLSRMRINGESIPRNILLVSLNNETAYLFDSIDFIVEEFLTDKKVDNITIGELDKYLSNDFIQNYLNTKTKVFSHIEYSDYNKITIGELEKYPK